MIKLRQFFLTLIFFSNIIAKSEYQSLTLTKRQTCDLELILNEGFAPLKTFLDQEDYNSVVEKMQLKDGSIWPIPIILDIDETTAKNLSNNSEVILRSPEGHHLANLKVTEIYKPDKDKEAQCVFGTKDSTHPGVNYLYNTTKEYYVSGQLDKIQLPVYYDFKELRKTPAQVKQYFKDNGITKVVAFQTRNPMHRAHKELTERAAKKTGAHLLLHPAVGQTKPGDIDHFTRVRCYKKLLKYYPEGSTTLSLLPLSMRMAGPREALLHALIRKNYGATHFIIGRDHAGPGKDKNANDFYGPYDAQNLVKSLEKEIGIKVVLFKMMVYVKEDDNYQPIDEVDKSKTILNISGTQLRDKLRSGQNIPSWFTYPEIFEELRKTNPPKDKQGFTVFFTGLSAAGKSTIANALVIKLTELQHRNVTLLDGDLVRTHLSKGLGFSKEDRSTNVRRVGYVASEITKHGGAAICALIAPYAQDREFNKQLISNHGNYIEVYVSTPLEVCEERDPKGLYAKAKEGVIPQFTGISDPYEEPKKAAICIDTCKVSVEEAVNKIINYINSLKLIKSTRKRGTIVTHGV